MNKRLALAALFLVSIAGAARAAAPAAAPDLSSGTIKKVLDQNPDLLLNVLKAKKKELFELVLEAQQEEQARQQKEQEEQARKDMEAAFKNPKQPAINEKAHVRGEKGAKYTLVEYSDFQCPYCGQGFQTVEALRKKYGKDLRFVYKNLPLPFHPNAMPAARYFEAVSLQSKEKAWKFHDKLFSNQQKLSEDFYKTTARALGLNVKRLAADVKSKEVQAKIDADMDEARTFGFTGTPGFLLNGIPLRGAYPVEAFDSVIDRLNSGNKN